MLVEPAKDALPLKTRRKQLIATTAIVSGFDFTLILPSQTMPKTKTNLPEWLPTWKKGPLKLAFSPDGPLSRGTFVKSPKSWKKVVRSNRKTRY
jgi:hypothetical protein